MVRRPDQRVDEYGAEGRVKPPIHLRGPQRGFHDVARQVRVALNIGPQVLQITSLGQLEVGQSIAEVNDVGDLPGGYPLQALRRLLYASPVVVLDHDLYTVVRTVELVHRLPVKRGA